MAEKIVKKRQIKGAIQPFLKLKMTHRFIGSLRLRAFVLIVVSEYWKARQILVYNIVIVFILDLRTCCASLDVFHGSGDERCA